MKAGVGGGLFKHLSIFLKQFSIVFFEQCYVFCVQREPRNDENTSELDFLEGEEVTQLNFNEFLRKTAH